MLIDLQIHSMYSDGYLKPTELAKFLAGRGVRVAALTDHNTIGGVSEFKKACAHYGIKPIVGMELYVKLNHKKFNILWFNFDKDHPDLHQFLYSTQLRRRASVRAALENLRGRGFRLNIDKILDKYNRYIPLNHIIDDIKEDRRNFNLIKKIFNNKNPREEEIMAEFFWNKNFYALKESYVNISRVMSLRKKVGGQIILNHPGKNNCLHRSFLEKIKKLGFDGIEVLSPHHSIGAVMWAQHIARELNLIATGGSDFHRHEGNNMLLQNCHDYFRIDTKYLKGIEKIIG